jgi:biotin carboxyl carrier protein
VKLRITVEGKTYDVEVEVVDDAPPLPPPAQREIKPPAAPPVSSYRTGRALKDDKNARSPLAGVVVSIAVTAGDRVERGDVLAIIEAMKMETKVLAPTAGVVKALRAAAGDAVKPGQVLVELV